ncbi:sigma-54-dependent transcriptional regulator [Maridesulfovibrio bastinii]|uniref:sigma-54-dependent transcriptional regulator n=1 Tax=Maridesulfovibrio bastinii TaxID=47157 RepID=UPI00040B2125|nr:sigma-54 dependent transcriptional regulator [Maridesulfovibrio bastinii]
MGADILVVDDDKAHLSMLCTIISGWGHKPFGVEDGSDAIQSVAENPYDAILMDVRMAKVGGIEALSRIKEINPSIPVIIMTAYSSVDTAVEAMKIGAYDYLTKPLNFDELKLTLERALEHMNLIEENKNLKERISKEGASGIIGRSEPVKKLLEMVKTVAETEATVLILGESGTGKELFAKAIHSESNRKNAKLVTVNCAALTDTLLESELFGHEKGSFTGADKKRDGRFVQADHGTLFLDEVGEIPMPMQSKLLRALQEGEIQRVGSDEILKVDVRIIAATNRDLQEEARKGNFREDLYYRLNVVSLKIPALADRPEDIPLLASFFLSKFAERNRKKIKGFTPGAMDKLNHYKWPGNVRELENAVERAVILTAGEYISEKDLPPTIVDGLEDNEKPAVEAGSEASSHVGGKPLYEIEKIAIRETLAETGWNKSEAARILNITRTTLDNKIKKYGIESKN